MYPFVASIVARVGYMQFADFQRGQGGAMQLDDILGGTQLEVECLFEEGQHRYGTINTLYKGEHGVDDIGQVGRAHFPVHLEDCEGDTVQ